MKTIDDRRKELNAIAVEPEGWTRLLKLARSESRRHFPITAKDYKLTTKDLINEILNREYRNHGGAK
jgi:hypothetical protein